MSSNVEQQRTSCADSSNNNNNNNNSSVPLDMRRIVRAVRPPSSSSGTSSLPEAPNVPAVPYDDDEEQEKGDATLAAAERAEVNDEEEDDDDEDHDDDDDEEEDDDDDNDSEYYHDEDSIEMPDEDDMMQMMMHMPGRRQLPPREIMNYFHLFCSMSDRLRDHDDSRCTCRNCTLKRFGILQDDDDEEEEDEKEVDEAKSKKQKKESSKNKDHHHHQQQHTCSSGAPCAICLEEETSNRPFASLPCCGGNGKDQFSSTRFCQQCLVKVLGINGTIMPKLDSSNGSGNVMSNDKNKQLEVTGECPRCKRLLLLQAKINNSNNNNKFRHKVKLAKTPYIMWYITKKKHGNIYGFILLTIALANPNYIPIELLVPDDNDSEYLQNLVQWGLLIHKKANNNNSNRTTIWRYIRRHCPRHIQSIVLFFSNLIQTNIMGMIVGTTTGSSSSASVSSSSLPENYDNNNNNNDVYCMVPQSQLALCQALFCHMEIDSDDDLVMQINMNDPKENSFKKCFLVSANFLVAGWRALSSSSTKKFRLIRAVRMWNRSLTLILLATGMILPWIGSWSADRYWNCWRATTVLNIVLVSLLVKMLVQLFWIALYLVQGILLAWATGACFVKQPIAWRRYLRTIVISCWVLYHGYRLYGCYEYLQSWWWFPAFLSSSSSTAVVTTKMDVAVDNIVPHCPITEL